MTDIVERLRKETDIGTGDLDPASRWGWMMVEAADEIQRLREALREIESNWEVPMEEKGWRALARFMWEKARAALGEKA